MTAMGAALCALLGVPVGLYGNLLIEWVLANQSSPEHETPPSVPLRLRWKRLSARDALVVATTSVLFAAGTLRFGVDAVLPAYLVFFASLVVMSVIDFEIQIIPNRIVYPTIFVSISLLVVAAAVEGDFDRLGTALLGAVLAFASLFVIHVVYPAGMGFGDVRLSFLLGLFLGWLGLSYVFVGMFLGFVLGAVLGLLLIAVRLRSRQDSLPFGPFLAAGAIMVVLVGEPIVRWWLHP